MEELITMKQNYVSKDTTVKTLAIKCYDEQLPKGFDDLAARIRSAPKERYQVIGIKHGVVEPEQYKTHYHILVRCMESENRTSKNGVKVRTILHLMGVEFREEDRLLCGRGALCTAGDFENYVMYLTHETDEAIRDDKKRYSVSDLVSNLNMEQIMSIRSQYVSKKERSNPTQTELVRLDREAEELGYNLGNYNEFYHSLPLAYRNNSMMKTIRKSYDYGVEQRLNADDYKCRLCVFITGPADCGKTYTSEKALKELGYKNIVTIGGGGTGKYDSVAPSTECLLLDDDTLDNALNVADNKICRVYRRGSNNPIWAGEMIVVTSNKTFEDWALKCKGVDREHIEALRSRFFVCHLESDGSGNLVLMCDSASERGEARVRAEMYMRFRDTFNQNLTSYERTKINMAELNNYTKDRNNDWPNCEKGA